MSYLDDRVLKIVDLRKQGVVGDIPPSTFGPDFGLCTNSLRMYEDFIIKVPQERISLEKAAERCGFSVDTMKIARDYYNRYEAGVEMIL